MHLSLSLFDIYMVKCSLFNGQITYRATRNFSDKLYRFIIYYTNSLGEEIWTLVNKKLILFIKIIYSSNHNVRIGMRFF